ncbi:MAG: alpha-glucosidase, partial [Acidobacteria bacterium]
MIFDASMKIKMRLSTPLFSLVVLCSCIVYGQSQWRPLGEVTAVEKLANGVELSAAKTRVRITVLAPNVVRLRYSAEGNFAPDQSFAVLPGAFPESPKIQIEDSTNAVVVGTGDLQVRIEKSPMRVAFLDPHGQVISEDHPRYPVSFDGSAFQVWKSMPLEEHYFGLGDKTGPLDRRDLAFTTWNTDIGYQESTDPIYKSIPFFIGMNKGSAYGIFLDDTYRSSFDFGKQFWDAYSFGAEAGELNYYFFYGPDPKRVVSDFTQLVGRTPLPPLFSLGYQQ